MPTLNQNWAEICSELKAIEKRAVQKMEIMLEVQRDPFPFDRLKKGKEIIGLSKSIRLLLEQDLEKDAEILLQLLLEKEVKLKTFR